MNKRKSLPHIPPNFKLIVRKRADGSKEYIIKPIVEGDSDIQSFWGFIAFAILITAVILIFGKY